MNETFRGHIEECLKHLSDRFLALYPKGNKRAMDAKRPMAQFCGVSVSTVTGWLYRCDHLPRGEQYIRLMCFLDLNGYKVIEFERLSSKFRNFARLLGFGLISSEQAIEMLGYKEPSTLFQLLRGNEGASKEVEEKMWDMWKARKDKLDEAIEAAGIEYRLQLSHDSVQQRPQAKTHDAVPTTTRSCPTDGVIDIMQGLLKLLDSGVLQNVSDTELTASSVSSSVILQLSSHLSILSARLVKSR